MCQFIVCSTEIIVYLSLDVAEFRCDPLVEKKCQLNVQMSDGYAGACGSDDGTTVTA